MPSNKRDYVLPETGFLRLNQVLQLIPVSRTMWHHRVKKGEYPRPVSLGERTRAYRAGDIRALIERLGKQATTTAPLRRSSVEPAALPGVSEEKPAAAAVGLPESPLAKKEKDKPQGRNTIAATKAWRAKAVQSLAAAEASWMGKATERAKSRSESEVKKGKSPKLSRTDLLREAKNAGAPGDMEITSSHFKAWRNTLPDDIVDRDNRNREKAQASSKQTRQRLG